MRATDRVQVPPSPLPYVAVSLRLPLTLSPAAGQIGRTGSISVSAPLVQCRVGCIAVRESEVLGA